NGVDAEGKPVFDTAGNLFAVTIGGIGRVDGNTIFELTPSGGGAWTETTIFTFGVNATHGYAPYAGLIFDSSGNLYGTTSGAGAYGSQYTGGTAFELIPQAGGGWVERVLHSFGNGTDGAL